MLTWTCRSAFFITFILMFFFSIISQFESLNALRIHFSMDLVFPLSIFVSLPELFPSQFSAQRALSYEGVIAKINCQGEAERYGAQSAYQLMCF